MDFLFLGPKNPPKWLLAVLSHRRSQNSETAGRLNLSWLHFPNECHQPFSHQLRCLTKLRQLYAAGNIWCCHQQIACDSITWIKRHAPIPESGILNRILQFPGPTCCGSQAEHNWDKKNNTYWQIPGHFVLQRWDFEAFWFSSRRVPKHVVLIFVSSYPTKYCAFPPNAVVLESKPISLNIASHNKEEPQNLVFLSADPSLRGSAPRKL